MKKLKVLLIMLIFFSIGFIGFSQGASEGVAVSTEKEPITLTYFRPGLGDDALLEHNAMMAPFYETHPWITVEPLIVFPPQLTMKLQAAIAGGEPPDIIQGLSSGAASKYQTVGGVLMDMAPYAEKDNFDWQSYYNPDAIAVYNIKPGTMYGINESSATYALAYNKDMFDAVGLSYPTDDWTWDDMLAAAQKLTLDTTGDGETDQWGLINWKADYSQWIWAAGSSFFTSDFSAVNDDAIVVDTLQWLADLRFKYKVAPTEEVRADYPQADFMFTQSKAAMCIASWLPAVVFFFHDLPFNWDVAMLPINPVTGERASQQGGGCISGFTATKNPEETYMLWRWMTSDEGVYARSVGKSGMPMLPGGPADKWPKLTEAFSQIDTPANAKAYVDMLPFSYFYEVPLATSSEVYATLDPILDDLWLGKKTAAEVVPLIKKAIDPLLKH